MPPATTSAESGSARAEARRHLEDVAAELFAAQGYAATTVDQIVAAAGVSKPALYRHFESKKDLYLTLLRRHREELAAAALAQVSSGQPLEEVLPAMIDAWFAHIEQHPSTSRLLFRDATGDPDIEAAHAEVHRRQAASDVALMQMADPPLPAEQLEPLGEVVRSALAGLAVWWLAHPETPRAVLVATMLRVARAVLG